MQSPWGSPLCKEKIAGIRHVALDLDGTIYKGRKLFPVTLPFLHLLEQHQIGYSFVTNNSSKNTRDYLQHLKNMGVPAKAEQIVVSTHATIRYLRKRSSIKKLCIVGTDSMREEFEAAGFRCVPAASEEEPDAVVIGFDPNMAFAEICDAAWWIKSGKLYIATHPDRVCPSDERTVLIDCGAMCAALREATGRVPDVVLGKPDPSMLDTILEAHQIEPEQLAMVGDRIYTDIAMAQSINAFSVLVLSGETTRAEAAALNPPADLVVDDLGAFGEMLKEVLANAPAV